MGWGFKLPGLPRPPSPPFMPPAAAKIVTAPVQLMAVATKAVAAVVPKGSIFAAPARLTAETAGTMATKSEMSANAALKGDLNNAARLGLQAVAVPSKATNDATLQVWSKIPGPVRTIVSTIVGAIFPVAGLVFTALDLQLAANQRRIMRLRAQEAKATAAEAAAIRAEIAALEADNARIEADRTTEAKARGIVGKKPTFKESVTFAWLNAFNKAKE